MKRLAMALVLLAAVGIPAEAASLPKAISLVERVRSYHVTHYVRGVESGKHSGGRVDTQIEARQTTPAPTPKQKPSSQPVRAD